MQHHGSKYFIHRQNLDRGVESMVRPHLFLKVVMLLI